MGGIVAAFTDLFAADAVMTGVEIATVVGTVGAGLSVVGAVTGNKTLSTIGGVMGVAGVVGGLTGAFDSLGGTFASADAGFGPTSNVVGAAAGADGAGSFTTPSAASNFSTDLNAFSPNSVSSGSIPYDSILSPQGTTAPFNGSQVLTGGPAATTPAGSGGLWDSFKNADPLVKYGVMQAAGSGLAGLSSAYTAQQKLALEKQQQDWAHQAYLTSVSNANAQPMINMPSVHALQAQAAQASYAPAATPAATPTAPGLIQGLVGTPTTVQ